MDRLSQWGGLLLLGAFGFWMSGCAHSYSSIQTESLTYSSQEPSDSITFSYRTDALHAAGNDQYSKKAREENVMPVAVRVENNRSEPITLQRRTLQVRSGNVERSLVNPGTTADMLGQAYGWYAFWGLLNVWYYRAENGKVVQQTYIPIGPVIGLINIIRGSGANSSMEKDFKKRHLLGTTVPPDTTTSGLVFVDRARGQPLSFAYTGTDTGDGESTSDSSSQ